ncbi:alcohol dehydrogenase catalytic domain-containing protein [Nocardia vaccinii]|uniref:alcohol dehydrogenase catalytic domain-containing protein n=1 Tax=Nocardia vaccinii TaxID=1822 RepID=UPI0035A25DA0
MKETVTSAAGTDSTAPSADRGGTRENARPRSVVDHGVALRSRLGRRLPATGTVKGATGLPQPPFVPGLEVAGTGRALGEGVEGLRIGEPVVTSTASVTGATPRSWWPTPN